ncbi:hypothetical protein RCL1_005704 [Eukaryota sp. TZLM3-RCL]
MTLLKSLFFCVLYGTVSLAITIFNKYTLAGYGVPSLILTLSQMAFSVCVLPLLHLTGSIRLRKLNWNIFLKVLPLALSFLSMVVTGLWSLRLLNIAVFSTLRRFSTLIIVFVEFKFSGILPPPKQLDSIWIMVSGAVLTSVGDLYFSFTGYSVCILNCFTTALYLHYVGKLGKKEKLTTNELLFYNNLISILFVLILSFFTGSFSVFVSSVKTHSSPGFWLAFLSSSALGLILNYTIFLNTQFNSPLATSITGQVKTIVQTVFGLFNTFGDASLTPSNLYGLLMGIVGSLVYSKLKFDEKRGSILLPVDEVDDQDLKKNKEHWIHKHSILVSGIFSFVVFIVGMNVIDRLISA